MPFDGSAAGAVAAVALVLALAWLTWPILLRRLRLEVRPSSDAAGLATLFVLLAVCLVVWALDPFSALLLLPALHLFLLIASPERRPRPPVALALVALALAPLALLVSFYAHQLGLGPGEVAWTCRAAARRWPRRALGGARLEPCARLHGRGRGPGDDAGNLHERTRGPGALARSPFADLVSYAGPGSLGGTESALRR